MTKVLFDGSLFLGTPKSMMLLESRHEKIGSIPKGLRLIAESAIGEIGTVRHRTRPFLYPKRHTIENSGGNGNGVVGNFLRPLE